METARNSRFSLPGALSLLKGRRTESARVGILREK